MSFVQLQNLYPSFDDKIQLVQSIQQTIMPALEGNEFPLDAILDIAVPLIYTEQDPSLYSPQQRRFQRWWDSKSAKEVRRFGKAAPAPVKLAVASAVALAYTTGSVGLEQTPEVRAYEDSALRNIGFGGTII